MSLISHGNNENTTQWQDEDIIDISNNWALSHAARNENNDIAIEPDGKASISVDTNSMKAGKLKVYMQMTSANETLSTDNAKLVAVQFIFRYAGKTDGSTDIDNKVYYPKYIFEATYRDEPCVMDLYDSRELQSVEVIIHNFERSSIIIRQINVCVSYTLQDQVSDSIVDAVDGLQEMIDKIQSGILEIPELTQARADAYATDPSKIPDNTLWWMKAYEYPAAISMSQLVQLVDYQNTIKEAIDNDIGLSDGSYIADSFRNQLVTNTSFRDTIRSTIEQLDEADEQESEGGET